MDIVEKLIKQLNEKSNKTDDASEKEKINQLIADLQSLNSADNKYVKKAVQMLRKGLSEGKI